MGGSISSRFFFFFQWSVLAKSSHDYNACSNRSPSAAMQLWHLFSTFSVAFLIMVSGMKLQTCLIFSFKLADDLVVLRYT